MNELANRSCGNCGTRTNVHGEDCLQGTETPCDRCGKIFEREELDTNFVCKRCDTIRCVEDGVGPSAEQIADKIQLMEQVASMRPEFRDRALLVAETLKWIAGASRWDEDVRPLVRGDKTRAE